jgi:nucleotide-binding universal stress UspA family protein
MEHRSQKGVAMYKNILVPLDGSEFGECSLEHVKAVASGCGAAQIILFRAVEPLSIDEVSRLAVARDDLLYKAQMDNQAEARNYLAKIRRKLAKSGLKVETVVVDGDAADEILAYAQNNKVDLIAMTTHGRSGASRWFFGSVAQKVLQHSPIPILLTAPSGCRISA